MSASQVITGDFVSTPSAFQIQEYNDGTPAERCDRAIQSLLTTAARYKKTTGDALRSAKLLKMTSESVVKCLGCPSRSHGDGECPLTCEQE